MHRRRWWYAFFCLAILAVGCGGDDDAAPAVDATPDAPVSPFCAQAPAEFTPFQ